jgi:hypothetical protein
MHLFGERGRIEVEIPFNAPPDVPIRVFVDDGSRLGDASATAIEFPPVDQYTVQADRFSEAVRGVASVAVSLETAIGNMVVIEKLFRSASDAAWASI